MSKQKITCRNAFKHLVIICKTRQSNPPQRVISIQPAKKNASGNLRHFSLIRRRQQSGGHEQRCLLLGLASILGLDSQNKDNVTLALFSAALFVDETGWAYKHWLCRSRRVLHPAAAKGNKVDTWTQILPRACTSAVATTQLSGTLMHTHSLIKYCLREHLL